MLRIDVGVIDAFEQREKMRFISEMKEHFLRLYPEKCPTNAASLEQLFLDAIQRASSYSIKSEQDVFRFLILMFELGPNFDTDPNLPWVSRILHGESTHRIRSLIESARYYLHVYSAP